MSVVTKIPFKCPICEGKCCKACNNTGIVWGEKVESLDPKPSDWGYVPSYPPGWYPYYPYYYSDIKTTCDSDANSSGIKITCDSVAQTNDRASIRFGK